MKRIIVLLVALVALAPTAAVYAQPGPYTVDITTSRTTYAGGDGQTVGLSVVVTEPQTIALTTLLMGPRGGVRFLDGGFSRYYEAGEHRAPFRYLMQLPDEPGDWQWICVASDPSGWLWVSTAPFVVE